MLFNSLEYFWFFPVVFALYWWMQKFGIKSQNLLLLVASYFFYSCWDWRFSFLLAFSTALDFFSGLMLSHTTDTWKRKAVLWTSIGINLGFLGFFKYYNFFIDSFAQLLGQFGFTAHYSTLQILLPVGISFYTFHGLSYVIDVYNRRIKPTSNWIDYSLFVSFFPLLVAGPIERATHLLPQIEKAREFRYDKAVDGCRQILWGLFKKMVIADNCALVANAVFADYANKSATDLAIGALFFSFQIYGDFSGYSDIALGSARLLGFDLLKNFNYPYFSRDIAEFWRRWHISLSSWFKDYLYIPLGGSQGGKFSQIKNTCIIFLVSGFWHGANWTFIVWGLINALFILPSIWQNRNRKHLDIVAKGKVLPNLKELFQILLTFAMATFAWIFFRAETLSDALGYISGFWNSSWFIKPSMRLFPLTYLLIFFLAVEWLGRESNYALERIEGYRIFQNKWPRWAFYFLLVFAIAMYMQTEETPFIYFNF